MKKSYNWVNQAGIDSVDDMEVVKSLDLDPTVAYTPKINQVALNAARTQAYDGYMRQGLTPKEAKSKAEETYKDAFNTIKQMEETTGKKFL